MESSSVSQALTLVLDEAFQQQLTSIQYLQIVGIVGIAFIGAVVLAYVIWRLFNVS